MHIRLGALCSFGTPSTRRSCNKVGKNSIVIVLCSWLNEDIRLY